MSQTETPRTIRPQTFSYKKPASSQQGKREVVKLCQLPTMRGSVHIIRRGGGEHLHSHKTVDGFWMVLSGRVAFYTKDDKLLGEFGPMEGVLIPRNNRYWFESLGDTDAEILQLLQVDAQRGFEREDHEPAKVSRDEINVFFGGTRTRDKLG